MVRQPRLMSMTGFGRALAEVDGRRVAVEVRSVNHRGLDVKVRGRGLSGAAEIEILRAVRAAVARGSLQVIVDEAPAERLDRERAAAAGAGSSTLDRVRAAHRELEQLRVELGLAAPVDLATAVALLRLERDRPDTATAPPELPWEGLAPALHEALAGLLAARAREGQLLGAELQGRVARLAALGAELQAHTAPLAARAARRLSERLSAAHAAAGGAAVDPTRLAQEAALLADRLDVSEELARFEAHRARLAELVTPGADAGASAGQGGAGQDAGTGRTLEFLLQELGRELNTLGAKAQDADVSALVIAGKAELEKIREQAQNIE
jgi:uncharacterized protein (TIGR00255 family)